MASMSSRCKWECDDIDDYYRPSSIDIKDENDSDLRSLKSYTIFTRIRFGNHNFVKNGCIKVYHVMTIIIYKTLKHIRTILRVY